MNKFHSKWEGESKSQKKKKTIVTETVQWKHLSSTICETRNYVSYSGQPYLEFIWHIVDYLFVF